ncbi:MAG: hypothetical protein LBL93_06070 [Ruminococcus sp.]|jgi:hypothetical protein|nr:hypothetical protein [Ruminococcus sp.]
MVSDKFSFSEQLNTYSHIPLKVQDFSSYAGLSPTNSRILSLISEEVIGMLCAILPKFQAEIWVENKKNLFEIHSSVSAEIRAKEKAAILETTGGENSAFRKGILGKIGSMLLDWSIELAENPEMTSVPYMFADSGSTGIGGYSYWSMKQYMDTVGTQEEKLEREDDGLERSIIVNLSDDCKIAVRSGSVQILVTKQFEQTGFTSKS